MNLHEQYAELLALGMPEHPRLVVDNSDTNALWPFWIGHGHGWKLHGRYYYDSITPDDARAIITMHAIDWLPTIGLELAQDGSGWVCYRVLEAKRFGTVKQEASRAPTILAAILAAAEHLAPKATGEGEGE